MSTGVKMSLMTPDVVVDGTEKLLGLDGVTSKTLTSGLMAAYAIDVLATAPAATPTTGDDIVAFRGAAEKLFDLDAVVTYAVAGAWSGASAVTPLLTGDLFLTNRAGVTGKAAIDTLKTYVLTGIQTTVTNLTTLNTGTPVAADLILISQSGAGKKATITALETLLWADYYTYVKALSLATSVADSDVFYCGQGATAKGVAGELLAEYVGDWIIADTDVRTAILGYLGDHIDGLAAVVTPAGTDNLLCAQGTSAKALDLDTLVDYLADELESTAPWRLIPIASYTALPLSTSSITMSSTLYMKKGLPVKYKYSDTTYYGVITDVTTNVSITIAGATLNAGVELQELYVGVQSHVEQVEFLVETAYGDAVQDVFADVTYERRRWRKGNAYLVAFSAAHGVIDTGAAQPKINVTIDGSAVSTGDANNGIQMSGVAGTWVDNGAVAISPTNYAIEFDDEIDISVTVVGTNGDADVLSVACLFVYE